MGISICNRLLHMLPSFVQLLARRQTLCEYRLSYLIKNSILRTYETLGANRRRETNRYSKRAQIDLSWVGLLAKFRCVDYSRLLADHRQKPGILQQIHIWSCVFIVHWINYWIVWHRLDPHVFLHNIYQNSGAIWQKGHRLFSASVSWLHATCICLMG